jgi:hypothetical protein
LTLFRADRHVILHFSLLVEDAHRTSKFWLSG